MDDFDPQHPPPPRRTNRTHPSGTSNTTEAPSPTGCNAPDSDGVAQDRGAIVHGEVLRRGSMLRQDRSHVLPRDISVKGHSSIVQAPQKHCTGFGLTRRTYLQPATHMAPDGHCTGQSDAIRPDSEAENANHKRCTPPAWLNLNTLWKILQSRYTALSRNATVGAHRRQGRNRTPPLGVARAQRMPPPTCDRSVAGSV